ncbi:MAG: adenylate/guanylate cyclase domain-containing protein [Caldilineaceae bacterium]
MRRLVTRARSLWLRASEIGLPDTFTNEQAKRLSLQNQATLFTASLTVVYFGLFWLTDLRICAWIMLVAFVGYMSIMALNISGHYRLATALLLVVGNLQIASVAFLIGRPPWIQLFLIAAAISPFLYYSMEDMRAIVTAAGLSLLLYILLEISFDLTEPMFPLEPAVARVISTATYLSNFLAAVFFTYYLYATNYRVESKLREERERADHLLLQILPLAIAQRMKAGESCIADHYECVTMLFADMVGFTPLAGELTPEASVDLLDEIFTYFDSLVEKHGVEKIKTIGDGYYVAAGVPLQRPDHAQCMASMALEMTHFREKVKSPLADKLQIRIGINSGTVVGGVIGSEKFQFDLWGDAVNVASRMESQGVAGKIQISPTTYELIKNNFRTVPRGSIEVRGKGLMDTWFLEDATLPQGTTSTGSSV